MLRPREVLTAALWTSISTFSICAAVALEPRATTIPAPISYTPDQSWDGIDGKWNSFTLRVGTPNTRYVRVWPATSSQQTWVVDSLACINTTFFGSDTEKCSNSRGRTFNSTASASFDYIGYYSLWIERHLGYDGYAQYGYDTVGLGNEGDNGPTIKNTTIGTFVVQDFWLGIFGLHPKSTNFSTFQDPSPSYMTYLKEQGHIPSMSYGYTAGAPYRFTSVLGSLTIGGYDSSRFIPNNLSVTFSPDNERELVVILDKISMSDTTQQDVTLLSTPIKIFIDSVVSHIWLPIEDCNRFEKAFGLTYDSGTDLYLLNSTQRDLLLNQNANVTFSIGSPFEPTGQRVDIVLPYSAFDLVASPPYRGLANETYYFPLRRAANDTQYTLGRTFLQEAYLLVDHERFNFSVSQVNWQTSLASQIVAIKAPATGTNSSDGTSGDDSHAPVLGTGAIVGIAVGIAGAVLAAAVVAFVLWRRRKQKKQIERAAKLAEEIAAVKESRSEKSSDGAAHEQSKDQQQNPQSPTGGNADGTTVFPKAELPANEPPRHELPCGDEDVKVPQIITTFSSEPVEADNNERQIFEMEGDTPTRSEADGRMLSEKETMIVRERRYNGTDIDPMSSPNTPTEPSENGLSPITPTSGESLLRPPPRRINPADVAMVPGTSTRLTLSPITVRNDRGWEGPVSPLTARAPVTLEETILSPLSPLPPDSDGSRTHGSNSSSNPDRKRFSYELDD